jgi:tetratricopeptide (TPR) repeat protein
MLAEAYKEHGNRLVQHWLFEEALAYYQAALAANPAYGAAWFNLANTYTRLGRLPQAVWAFQRLLSVQPADHEARVMLSELLETQGRLPEALQAADTVLGQAPTFDPARRQAAWLRQRLAGNEAAFSQVADAVRSDAKAVLSSYLRQDNQEAAAQFLEGLAVVFAPTQQVHHLANISEYDHARQCVRFRPQMAYAHPRVLAAYLAHELVHAMDGDEATSIWEEQDAYRAATKFWLASGAQALPSNPASTPPIQEPPLDRAAAHWQESPARLYQRVEETYLRRNPSMLRRSPGHGLPLLHRATPEENKQQWQGWLEAMAGYRDFLLAQLRDLSGFQTPANPS